MVKSIGKEINFVLEKEVCLAWNSIEFHGICTQLFVLLLFASVPQSHGIPLESNQRTEFLASLIARNGSELKCSYLN
jgi:hypothetical protein